MVIDIAAGRYQLQTKKIEKLRERVMKMIADEDFASVYLEDSIKALSDENDRPFGVTDIDALHLYHLLSGYGSAWSGNEEHGRGEVALAGGYLVLSAEIYFADRRCLIATEGRSLSMGWSAILLGLARLISQGNYSVADWWARQLVEMLPTDAYFLENALPDNDLARHLLLLGQCWAEQRWARSDESLELGVYAQLWTANSDGEFEAALQKCIEHRFKKALGTHMSTLALPANSLYPLELLATIHLYKKLANPVFQTADLFLSSDLSRALSQLDCRDDGLIQEMRRRAAAFYANFWDACPSVANRLDPSSNGNLA